MVLKESGYNEFLAEKVNRGREDIATGRVYTRGQMQQKIEELLVKKANELDEIAQDNLTYA